MPYKVAMADRYRPAPRVHACDVNVAQLPGSLHTSGKIYRRYQDSLLLKITGSTWLNCKRWHPVQWALCLPLHVPSSPEGVSTVNVLTVSINSDKPDHLRVVPIVISIRRSQEPGCSPHVWKSLPDTPGDVQWHANQLGCLT